METCSPSQLSEAAPAIALLMSMFMIFIFLVVTALMVFAYCKIFSKAGYSWALGLLMLVPIANIIMPFVLAFGDWPILKEIRRLREQQGQSNSAG